MAGVNPAREWWGMEKNSVDIAISRVKLIRNRSEYHSLTMNKPSMT